MKSVAIFITFTLSLAISAMGSKGSFDAETSCRIKAKEVAAENYRTCITERKTLKINKLRQEYNEEMRALKEKFERKISKLGGKFQKSHPSKAQKSTESSMINEPEQEESRSSSPDEATMDIPEPIPVDREL